MRFVLGGTTSINGSGSVDGFLRNLDRSNALEGLNVDAVEYETFPLGDSGGSLQSEGCDYSLPNASEIWRNPPSPLTFLKALISKHAMSFLSLHKHKAVVTHLTQIPPSFTGSASTR